MRKLTTNFASVIFLLVIMLIPSNSVDAATDYYLNYEDITFSDEYKTEYDKVIEYLQSIEDTHYVFFAGQPNINFSINVVKKTDDIVYSSDYEITYNGVNLTGNSYPSTKVYYNFLRHIALADFASQFKTFKNRISSDTYYYALQSFVFQATLEHENNVMTSNNLILYYTNYENLVFDTSYDYNLVLNGQTLEKGAKVTSYYAYYNALPSIKTDVRYFTDIEIDLPQAEIEFEFLNYNNFYTYEYSFNGKNYTKIDKSKIVNNKYTIDTYSNGTIYYRVLNTDNEIVFEDSTSINMIIDENMNYYEIPIINFYNSEENKINYYYFFYDNIKYDFKPYMYVSVVGDNTNEMPFSVIIRDSIIDKTSFLNGLSFDGLSCSSMPYEYLDTRTYFPTYLTSTGIIIIPCIDLETTTFDSFSSEKIVIRTNLELSLNGTMVDGVLRPNPEDLETETTEIMEVILSILNPILEKMPFLGQLQDIYNILSYDYGEGQLPEFKVDLSFLGIEQEVNVIDFTYFVEYRDTIFFFEKIFLGFYTLIGVFKNASNALT